MSYSTRVRLLRLVVALAILTFVAALVALLVNRERPAPEEEAAGAELLSEDALAVEAEQVSTGFEVTRTREGAVELTVRAEKLLGLEGNVYLLQQPTLEIHHEDGETSRVVGTNGTFDMETGDGRVEGEAHAELRGGMEVEAPVLSYRQGGAVHAQGGARFRQAELRGRSDKLRYIPGGETVLLQGDVHVEGSDPGDESSETWTLETERLRYRSQAGDARTTSFRLRSTSGLLTGDRLDLLHVPGESALRQLTSTGHAALEVPVVDRDGSPAVQVLDGHRIDIEPAEDDSQEPQRLLAEGLARLSRRGEPGDPERGLQANRIEWFRPPASPGGLPGARVDARGAVVAEMGTAEGAARLTTSRLEAWLDAEGGLRRGRAFDPVRYQGPEGNARSQQADFSEGGEQVALRSPTGALAVMEIPEGRIAARRIDLRRGSAEMVATDEVRTLHSGSQGGGLFQGDQPVHGTADRVVALRREGRVRYEGAARLWQEENLLQAEEIEIQRDEGILSAGGRVSTRSVAEAKDGGGARVVRGAAEHLIYRDATRTAVYSRQAHLEWGEQRVEAEEILIELGDEGGVQRVQAEGGVELSAPGRWATGHRLDYSVELDRAVLTGGDRLAMAQNLENQQVVHGQTLTMDLSGGTIEVLSGPGGRTWIALSPNVRPPDAERRPGETGDRSLATPPGR